MLHGSEQPRIVLHDANPQKWIEWLPQTIKTYGCRERRQPRGTPHGHGPLQLSRTANAPSQMAIHYSRPDPETQQGGRSTIFQDNRNVPVSYWKARGVGRKSGLSFHLRFLLPS